MHIVEESVEATVTDREAIQVDDEGSNGSAESERLSDEDQKLIAIVVSDAVIKAVPDNDRRRIVAELGEACRMRRLFADRDEKSSERFGLAFAALVMPTAVGVQWTLDLLWFDSGFTWRTVVNPIFVIFLAGLILYYKMKLEEGLERPSRPPFFIRFSIWRWWGARLNWANALYVLLVGIGIAWGWIFMPAGIFTVPLTIGYLVIAFLICGVIMFVASEGFVAIRSKIDARQELLSDLAALLAVALVGENDALELPRMPGANYTPRWRSDPRDRRFFARSISDAARRVEKNLPRLAPRRQSEVKKMMRELAAGIAATLRQYAYEAALGGVNLDCELTGKLRSELIAASYGRWGEMVVVAPAPRVQRFLRRFWPRLLGASVLIAAAIVVPAVFASQLGIAGGQVIVGLLITAALVLFDTPKSAIDKFAEFVTHPGGRS